MSDTTDIVAVPAEVVERPWHPAEVQRDTFSIIADVVQLAGIVAGTEMVPEELRNRPDAVAAVVLAGHELGLPPMQALSTVHLIKGRPSLAAEAMRALVISAGHSIHVSADADEGKAIVRRREWPSDRWETYTFSMADAKLARLTGNADSGWTKYPRAMLTARATSEACRAVFPDVIRGVSYTPEEVESLEPPVPATVHPIQPDAEKMPANGAKEPAKPQSGPVLAGRVIEVRLGNAHEDVVRDFQRWRERNNMPWPPDRPAVVKAMSDELDRLERAREWAETAAAAQLREASVSTTRTDQP
jgi:hypothetical protein